MVTVTMKELLEAGVHFGHQVRRWNPKMKEYIFGERNGIYIIDLQKTQKLFRDALNWVTESLTERPNQKVLFVGTKRQAQDAIKEEAERCGQFYVNNRWLGGLLGDPIGHVVGEPSSVLGHAPFLQRLHVPGQGGELRVPGEEVARVGVAAIPAQIGVEESLEQRAQRLVLAHRDTGKCHGLEPTTVPTTTAPEGACRDARVVRCTVAR